MRSQLYSINEQSLASALGIRQGITAVIGSGGKTSLLRSLAYELPDSVILCTSTHIRPFSEFPCLETKAISLNSINDTTVAYSQQIRELLSAYHILCIGTPEEEGRKYTMPSIPFKVLSRLASYVLVEADGSRSHPFKAHTDLEPVIPEGTIRTIHVVGASSFLQPIHEVVHRPELFCQKINKLTSPTLPVIKNPIIPEDYLSPELAASYITHESSADICFLTQLDVLESRFGKYFSRILLQRFQSALTIPIVTASF